MRQIYLGFIILILLVSPVFAQEVEIKITPENQTTYYRVEANFTVEVFNNQSKSDSFHFTTDGPYYYWPGFYNSTLTVQNNSKESTKMVLFPSNDIGSFSYKITVISNSNSSINATREVFLKVKHPDGMVLKEYYSHWQDRLFPNFFVRTDEKRLVKINLEILDENGNVVEKTSASKEIERDGNIYEFVGVSGLLPGKYKLRSIIEGTSIEKIENITIEADENIKSERKINSNPLYEEVIISITNLGNVPKKDYEYFEFLQKGTPVNFITKIEGFEKNENSIKYKFKIPELKPGDTVEIVYRIEYWQGILINFAAIIIALGIMIWYLNRLRNPRIRKKYLKKKAGFTVVLEIRGSMFNHLKNVTVRDWVSSLAKVQQNFETIKPVVRGSEVGTELIWKLGDLKRGEDRIIHYDIVPNQLGTIKLDKAWMRYSKTEDKQYKKFSNVVVVDVASA